MTGHLVALQVALQHDVQSKPRFRTQFCAGDMDALWCRGAGCGTEIVSSSLLFVASWKTCLVFVFKCGADHGLLVECSIARIRRLGVTNLQTDDYLMMFAVVWYTLLCVALNQVASGGGSNLMSEDDIKSLTPTIKADRIRGSKWVFVSEHCFLLAIWAMKACMLVIYARITYDHQ